MEGMQAEVGGIRVAPRRRIALQPLELGLGVRMCRAIGRQLCAVRLAPSGSGSEARNWPRKLSGMAAPNTGALSVAMLCTRSSRSENWAARPRGEQVASGTAGFPPDS